MGFAHKHIIGTQQLSKEDIELILETAESFKEINLRDIKKVPTLRGKTIINLFYENSTRTRTSFELAGKRMSADTINISASGSSVTKGETLEDTAKNIEAMNADVIVMRHSCSGAPDYLAKRLTRSAVINAGDGAHEHPSQALLDLMTIKEHKGRIEGLTVAIIGDIARSRVARSDLYALKTMGATVRLAGPATMLPPGIDELGAEVYTDINEAIKDADVVIMLRIQLEREGGNTLIPTLREYAQFFALNTENIKLAKPDAIVMHPGPLNRGVEISSYVADGGQNVILDQVENGVAVRMALLYLLAGGNDEE
ncbi:aspartate carbamoyltransferase catalytic subunit [Desulfuromonas acetoxidans]|uniref:Aspartate carbamoyltransferase n=1 Tax=Desulfuromonas acetoxidans (strain DSM 684 / 11070) TaxID=281689 RepID=Q1K1T7_DESA6|nr:aspartate carbamoyltransferase catalytic subunit [Desulfuromonas acetoxidans]EAT16301.1 aspartate carbamoyltransferase [Desulfuromonas acetoxidans DSM 684]MBF0644892.1 aspartate carbamoyltransferase catalytic subunit [Desulfuromonas acetoxidans]NVD25409.1 aspartate carbamoyltransferase catalytic subunit [Desulfuromonas acetoxidans]NVE17490.1 aspartate carbamoyltransferase catalytic subunit [Desulfuromonas acetoxidans]